jgi:hypothetical protein
MKELQLDKLGSRYFFPCRSSDSSILEARIIRLSAKVSIHHFHIFLGMEDVFSSPS